MSADLNQRAMNLPDNCFPAYVLSHEAWYHRVILEGRRGSETGREINVMAQSRGGGVAWEFTITEHELSRRSCLRLNVFDEAWPAITQMPEVFRALADLGDATVENVTELLTGFGFTDLTERKRPTS